MKSEFRQRVLLPLVLPLVVLLAAAAFIGAVAAALLYNTHAGALMLAAVLAAGILFTVGLASSQDRLGGLRRAVVVLVAFVPLLVAGGIAAGLVGDVDDADRNINVEPAVAIPDDSPVIAAENSLEFCLPENAACEPIDEWEVVPSQETDQIAFFFDNREVGVPHNVVITSLEGTPEDPEAGDETFVSSTLVDGPVVDAFISPDVTWDELPETWYFLCAIHPNMNGVGRVVNDQA